MQTIDCVDNEDDGRLERSLFQELYQQKTGLDVRSLRQLEEEDTDSDCCIEQRDGITIADGFTTEYFFRADRQPDYYLDTDWFAEVSKPGTRLVQQQKDHDAPNSLNLGLLHEVHVHFDDEGVSGFVFFYGNGSFRRSKNVLVSTARGRATFKLNKYEYIVQVGHVTSSDSGKLQRVIFTTNRSRKWEGGKGGADTQKDSGERVVVMYNSVFQENYGLHDIIYDLETRSIIRLDSRAQAEPSTALIFGHGDNIKKRRTLPSNNQQTVESLYELALQKLPGHFERNQRGAMGEDTLVEKLSAAFSTFQKGHNAKIDCARNDFLTSQEYLEYLRAKAAMKHKKREARKFLEKELDGLKTAYAAEKVKLQQQWASGIKETINYKDGVAKKLLENGWRICSSNSCNAAFHLASKVYSCTVEDCPSRKKNCGCDILTCRGCGMDTCWQHSLSHRPWCESAHQKRCGYYFDSRNEAFVPEQFCGKFLLDASRPPNSCSRCSVICCSGCSQSCSGPGNHIWCKRCLASEASFRECCGGAVESSDEAASAEAEDEGAGGSDSSNETNSTRDSRAVIHVEETLYHGFL